MISFPLDIPHIGERLGVIGIHCDLSFEFFSSIVILMQLPIEKADAEMKVGLARRDSSRRPKFLDRLRSPAQTIERFSAQYVRARGIWICLEDLAEFFQRARIILRPQAALR